MVRAYFWSEKDENWTSFTILNVKGLLWTNLNEMCLDSADNARREMGLMGMRDW